MNHLITAMIMPYVSEVLSLHTAMYIIAIDIRVDTNSSRSVFCGDILSMHVCLC